VLDIVADRVAEHIQDHLPNDEEEDAKRDVTQWPAVLERADYEDDLAHNVDEQEDGVHDVGDDEDADGVDRAQAGPVLESQERDCAADNEHGERREAQQPDRECRPVFIQLESDEAIDQQTRAQSGCKAILCGGEVRVRR